MSLQGLSHQYLARVSDKFLEMHEEPKTLILTERLWREIIIRNRYSGLTHLVIAIAAFFFSSEIHLSHPVTFTGYGLIILGSLYRAIILNKISKIKIPTPSLEVLHDFSVSAIGFGWGFYWYDMNKFYGRYSIHDMFALLVLSSFVSGAITPHAPRPRAYYYFVFSIAIIPLTVFFTQLEHDVVTLAFCIIFFLSYNFYQIRVSHRSIKDEVTKDLEIKQERTKLQTFMNAVPGFVCFIDQHLKYLMMNEYAQQVFKTEVIGESINQNNPSSPFVIFVTEFMKSHKPMATAEILLESNPGNLMAIISIQKLNTPTGGAVIIALPMEELLEAREKVRIQEMKTFNTAKLLSLGEMAAGIAHEINNPLAIILGSADQMMRTLKRDGPDLGRLEVLTEKIQRTVERISAIIKSLRVLSRNGEKDPAVPFKIEAILEPSFEISRQRFLHENVQLEIEKADKEILCIGQEVPLSQVIMNILGNAFDAAVEGPSPRWVRLKVDSTEGFIDICVEDSGNGIPKEIRHKIMDPFFTTKPINKGTGLGLSISKSIMEQHGGTLVLDESAPNTTFIIRLKAAPSI